MGSRGLTRAEAGSGEALKTAGLGFPEHDSHCSCGKPAGQTETSTPVWDEEGWAENESEKGELTLCKAQQLEGCRECGIDSYGRANHLQSFPPPNCTCGHCRFCIWLWVPWSSGP